MENVTKEYADYLTQTNITKEINPICVTIDEMLTRLDEFDNLLSLVNTEGSITTKQNIPQLYQCQDEFDKLCTKIDNLERFVGTVNVNLNELEQVVSQSEEELGLNNVGLKGFFKPLLGKIKMNPSNQRVDFGNSSDIQTEVKPFNKPTVFKTNDYFGKSEDYS